METVITKLARLKKQGQVVVAHGYGVNDMLQKCYHKGLNKNNSTLIIRNGGELDSEYWVLQEKTIWQ